MSAIPSKWENLSLTPSFNSKKVLSLQDFHGYQFKAVDHGLAHPQASFWIDMGLGKTVSALTVMQQRMDALQIYGTLVLAPLRVCQTVWRQEANKWSHTGHLKFSLVHGTPDTREIAILRRADVYLVNYENVVWLVQAIERLYLSQGKYPPFNILVLD